MNVAQTIAIAAAAWVTALASESCVTAQLQQALAMADVLATKWETLAATRMEEIGGGFRATPDGLRMERGALR